jgi:hypothetical protein
MVASQLRNSVGKLVQNVAMRQFLQAQLEAARQAMTSSRRFGNNGIRIAWSSHRHAFPAGAFDSRKLPAR